MKKRILIVSAVMAAASVVLVPGTETKASSYGMAGCGVGSYIFKKNDLTQVLAATTNDFYGTQTFAITTGTLNCTPGGAAFQQRQQEVFVTVNFESLEKEMAAGQGEKLEAFSSLMGCKSSAAFGTMARENYTSFFGADASPSSVLAGVKNKIGTTCDI